MTLEGTVQTIPINDLHQDPSNARRHDARNKNAIHASLEEHGQVEPLVVQEGSGMVIGGNARLEVMRELGWTEAACVVLDVTDHEATRLGLALNRTAEFAAWDEETLGTLLADLRDDLDSDLWEDEEVNELLENPVEPADEEEMMFEPAYEVIVKCGSETMQEQTYEKLTKEGYECRLASM